MGCNYYPPPRNKFEKVMEFWGGIVFISVLIYFGYILVKEVIQWILK